MTLLAIDNLTWVPPGSDEPPLFEGASLEVEAGELVRLDGPSGAGKSTFLRCMVGLEPRVSGEIRWRGDTVEPSEIRQFRRRVHYLQQEPVEVAPTIAENLAFSRQMASGDDETARTGLEAGDQQSLLDELGLGDLDGERGFAQLSVGERQRVALVRSLTLQPNVLLLDEPTASLDPRRSRQIEGILTEYLDEQPDRRALVWVTHSRGQRDRLGGRVVTVGELT